MPAKEEKYRYRVTDLLNFELAQQRFFEYLYTIGGEGQ
jgi:hypothetical protein